MKTRSDTTVLMVCATVLVAIIIGGAVLAFIASPEGRDPSTLVAIIVATLAPTVASLTAVLKVGGVSAQVADVAADTERLTNGMGDAKIRAAVADVLPDHLVDPAVQGQLTLDRARLARPEDHE